MLTSILSGFVVFAFLGALAHKLDVPIDDVAQGGKFTIRYNYFCFVFLNKTTLNLLSLLSCSRLNVANYESNFNSS